MAVQHERTSRIEFGSGLLSRIAHEAIPEEPAMVQPAWRPLRPADAPTALPPPDAPFWEYTSTNTEAEPTPQPAATDPVRALLNTRAAAQAERIWSVYDDALQATDAHGRPDHTLRLQAAAALLAATGQAPDTAPQPTNTPHADTPDDELSKHRRSRRHQL